MAFANQRSKFIGGMIGSALGDAIGELAFVHGDADSLLAAVEQAQELVYTDDTAMAIGLAESLKEKGVVDQQHLGDTFRRNYEREPWRGYAMGPPTIFAVCRERGVPYVQAAKGLFGGTGSYGNGPAMRIAPIGLFYHDSGRLLRAVSLPRRACVRRQGHDRRDGLRDLRHLPWHGGHPKRVGASP